MWLYKLVCFICLLWLLEWSMAIFPSSVLKSFAALRGGHLLVLFCGLCNVWHVIPKCLSQLIRLDRVLTGEARGVSLWHALVSSLRRGWHVPPLGVFGRVLMGGEEEVTSCQRPCKSRHSDWRLYVFYATRNNARAQGRKSRHGLIPERLFFKTPYATKTGQGLSLFV